MKIGFYKYKGKSKRNLQYPYVVVYNYDKDWPEATLKQRGLLGNRCFERNAYPQEIEVCNNSYRAVSYRYKTIDLLLEDEQRAGCASPLPPCARPRSNSVATDNGTRRSSMRSQ